MNELISELTDRLPIEAVVSRSWFEIVSIMAPSVLLVLVLFGFGLLLKEKSSRVTVFLLCTVLTLFFLPYELFRQASVISKADENIHITQNQLKKLLTISDLDHLESMLDQQTASGVLNDLKYGVGDKEKQALIFTGWLLAENGLKTKQHVDRTYQSLNQEIQTGLNSLTDEVINSRQPVERISKDMLERMDHDISQLIVQRMSDFTQKIEQAMNNFQGQVSSFIHDRLQGYEQKMAELSQKNSADLEYFSDRARLAFATQVSRSNRASMQKLDDTQNSVEALVAELTSANLEKLTKDVKQLTSLMELTQKKNEILFQYKECVRLVGVIDFSGKEEQCRRVMERNLAKL